MSQAWKIEFWRVLGLFLLALLSGFLWRLLPCLLIAVVLVLLWHGYQLSRLIRWLEYGEPPDLAFPRGLWRDTFIEISRLKADNRKRKRRLERFVERFQEVAAALPDATVILGRHDQIQWCNPAAQTLLGLSWPQVADESLTDLVTHPILQEYLKIGDYSRPLELPSPVNKAKVLSLRINPFGKKHQRLLVASDITRIYHLDQARRDFVANASHELRTPLTVIRGFLETLTEEDGCSPDWPRSLVLMQQQARRMQDIISDLIMLSRLEMEDEGSKNHCAVSIPKLLNKVVQDAQMLSGERRHELSLQVEEPGLWLTGNEEELRSAFSNLLFNAVLYTPPRSKINVRWSGWEEGAELLVSDSGEGIGARHIPRLTERFYRVEEGRSREAGGTGLGLAIVKHVLSRHQSELHIVSQVGEGSTFRCLFPKTMIVTPE